MSLSLAIKYRPKKWEDVVEQDSVKIILQNQLDTGEIKNSLLFVGGAGTGKTTSARIYANELNKGMGNPIELDAASNNGVDDVRNIIKQAQSKSLDSEYKVFIIDECHALSNSAWQAMLKLIEEPPAKSVFIFCTTNPEKIPKTILSRVQRYDFKMISQDGIIDRLQYILECENRDALEWNWEDDAIEYIAKLADGHLRDSLTMLDKCLAYSQDLTLENVVNALGTTDYEIMFKLLDNMFNGEIKACFDIVEEVHSEGKDLKQFVHTFIAFLLDISKYGIGCDWKYISIPQIDDYIKYIQNMTDNEYNLVNIWLKSFIRLNADIKYSATPKIDIECMLMEVLNEDI